MKTIRTKQTKVHFACFVKRDKHGIIVKTPNLTKRFMLTCRFRCSNRRSFLNSLIGSLRPRANVESKSRRIHLKLVRQRVDFIPAWQQTSNLCRSYFTSCTSLKHRNKYVPPCDSPDALLITARSCQQDAGIQ